MIPATGARTRIHSMVQKEEDGCGARGHAIGRTNLHVLFFGSDSTQRKSVGANCVTPRTKRSMKLVKFIVRRGKHAASFRTHAV
jgi:hypothetical protein